MASPEGTKSDRQRLVRDLRSKGLLARFEQQFAAMTDSDVEAIAEHMLKRVLPDGSAAARDEVRPTVIAMTRNPLLAYESLGPDGFNELKAAAHAAAAESRARAETAKREYEALRQRNAELRRQYQETWVENRPAGLVKRAATIERIAKRHQERRTAEHRAEGRNTGEPR
ncbi:MAG TPA: hypothetical protein VGF29_05965 [Hyphomicrobiaceae bacterium]|jgi:hypothetical protein